MRRSKVAVAAAGLASYVSFAPAAPAATELPVELTWEVPPRSGCPSKAEAVASLASYIGTEAARGHAPIVAVATIRRRAGEMLELRLITFDGAAQGERVFRDSSCRSVAEAAVVVLAWMIDPDSMSVRSETPPEPERRSLPDSHVPAHAVTTPQASLKTWAAFADGGIDADWGTLPKPALGVHLRLGLVLDQLRFTGYGKFWPHTSQSLPPLTGGSVPGASFTLWSLGLEACLMTSESGSFSRLGLAFCLGPELEVLHGAGFGITVPAEATKTWLSLAATVEGRLRLAGPLSLLLGAGGVVPSQRERFALRGVSQIYRPRAFAARAQLGVALEL